MHSLGLFSLLSAAALALASPPAHSHHARDVQGPQADQNSTCPEFTFKELYNMTTSFFDSFMYPNNAVQAKMINSTIFSDNVIGRVDVTRNFVGRELNTEYAFGLFSQLALDPNAFSLLGVPRSYEVTHFVANQNIISAAVIIEFNITALDLVTPVEIDFWATFNAQKQISQYDATFRYLQWQFDYLLQVGMTELHLNTTAAVQNLVADKLAQSICATAMQFCNGTNQQYNSTEECQTFLTHDVPFGQAYQLGFNTLLCRMVHQNMVPIRPDVHCPHIGPTGGAYCVNDRTYSGNVLQPLFTIQPFVPYGFANRNATIAAE